MTFYIGSRLLDDPSKDTQIMIDEFAETYYGAAAPAMKKLLILIAEAVKKDKNCAEYLNFAQRSYMKDTEFFRQAFALIAEAEKAVANNKTQLTRVWQENFCWNLLISKHGIHTKINSILTVKHYRTVSAKHFRMC